MKVVIAGSRELLPVPENETENEADARRLREYQLVVEAIEESDFEITEVVSGGARGVDRYGEIWAEENNIPIKQMKPDWDKGRGAGFARNSDLVAYGDALVAVHNGSSRGTMDTVKKMKKKGGPVHIKTVS